MKKLFFVVTLLLSLYMWPKPIAAQQSDTSDKFICLYRADMETYCPGLLSDLERRYGPNLGVNPNVGSASRIAGLSREIGTAVNDALTSLTNRSEQIAKTDAGKFTLTMIAYKVMGKALIRLLFGLPILILVFFLFAKWWGRIGVPQFNLKKRKDNENIFDCELEYPSTGQQVVWGPIFLFVMMIILLVIA